MPGGPVGTVGGRGLVTSRLSVALGLSTSMVQEVVGIPIGEGLSRCLRRLLVLGVWATLPRGVAAGEPVCTAEVISVKRLAFIPAGVGSLVLGAEPDAVRFLPAMAMGGGGVVGTSSTVNGCALEP